MLQFPVLVRSTRNVKTPLGPMSVSCVFEMLRRAYNSATMSSYDGLTVQRKKMRLDVYMSLASRRAYNSATVSSYDGLKVQRKTVRLDV